MTFDDLKVRTKTFIPIGLMSLTVLAMIALAATRIDNLSVESSKIIEQRELGAAELAAARQSIVYVPYDIFASLAYDNEATAGRRAPRLARLRRSRPSPGAPSPEGRRTMPGAISEGLIQETNSRSGKGVGCI